MANRPNGAPAADAIIANALLRLHQLIHYASAC